MENQFQLTIDGNEATFEITDAPQAMAEPARLDIDAARPILVVTTMRDGEIIWSGIGFVRVVRFTRSFTG